MAGNVALVAGASGIIGAGVVDALRGAGGWRVRALATRPVEGGETLAVDLGDEAATREALRGAADTTHLFYAAYRPAPDFAAEVAE